MTYFEHELQ